MKVFMNTEKFKCCLFASCFCSVFIGLEDVVNTVEGVTSFHYGKLFFFFQYLLTLKAPNKYCSR